jgi:hypothetical protein
MAAEAGPQSREKDSLQHQKGQIKVALREGGVLPMGMKAKLAPRIQLAGFIAFLLLSSALIAAAPGRVVAVGDVHGAFTELVAILQRTGLIDGNRQWAGGNATLVQTGDLLDRGPQVRQCLDLLMGLERQAQKQKGKVILLFGNHEIMNIMGDLRYVTPEIYASFITSQSEKVRDRAYRDYLQFLSVHRDHAHTRIPEDETTRQKWIKEHPLGYFEYRDAMSPRGKYGRWLRDHRTIVQIGDGLFVHGGLNPMLKFRTIAELDGQVRSELESFDLIWQLLTDKKLIWRYMELQEATQQVAEELMFWQASPALNDPEASPAMRSLLGLGDWMAVSSDGPLWYRGLAQEPEENLAAVLESMLTRLKARYIVSGHTVNSKSDITSRFNNQVFLIDTGMLTKAYEGRPSALEIQDGRFVAYSTEGEPKVLAAPALGSEKPPAVPSPGNRLEW